MQPVAAQYTAANAHSHNDYLQARPFAHAFERGFGSVEADVFERNGELYVAHTAAEIDTTRTLRRLYLQPLQQMIAARQGLFAATGASLQLLIDFKTNGVATMAVLLQQLQAYPSVTGHPRVQLVISGNRPDAALWSSYPSYILFDGRPSVQYTAAQLRRIPLISDNFRSYTAWNGKGTPAEGDATKLRAVVDAAHGLQKKFRFWATPDEADTWKAMMELGVDYINTDKVDGLADYLRHQTSK
jgi:alkaline phosphatase